MVLARAGIGLLAAAIVFGSVSVCPRGGVTCPMRKASAHRCCGPQVTVDVADCCGGGSHAPASFAKATSPDQDHRSASHALVPFVLQAVSMAGPTYAMAPYWQSRYGPAPPDTPITRHITLLL